LLTAIDTITGCTSTFSKQVVIQKGIMPSFTISSKIGCMPHTVIITNTTQPASDFVFCEFEVGSNTYTGNVISALLYNPGKYSVTMTIRDKNDCEYFLTKEDSILVNGADVKFSSSPNFGCAPLLVQVRDSSVADLPIRKRIWYWGTSDSAAYNHIDSLTARYKYLQPPAYQNGGY
jgi:PKD repeat protein